MKKHHSTLYSCYEDNKERKQPGTQSNNRHICNFCEAISIKCKERVDIYSMASISGKQIVKMAGRLRFSAYNTRVETAV